MLFSAFPTLFRIHVRLFDSLFIKICVLEACFVLAAINSSILLLVVDGRLFVYIIDLKLARVVHVFCLPANESGSRVRGPLFPVVPT